MSFNMQKKDKNCLPATETGHTLTNRPYRLHGIMTLFLAERFTASSVFRLISLILNSDALNTFDAGLPVLVFLKVFLKAS